ncbi:MAG: COX15/CtaA family protein [Pseudomonadota bacterium]
MAISTDIFVAPRARLRPETGAKWVRGWLLIIAAMVYAMILVGGATRLTDSGLSITEWRPIAGAMPPLNAADWASEFDKYRQTAEYQLQNKGMSLSEFQFIYWWEWGHRQLGRLVGVVFFIPFVTFWALGWTNPALRRRLWVLFSLGGLQGFIGWWMVSSGIGETTRVDVAPYRLMTHFTLALLIIALCFWNWLSLAETTARGASRSAHRWAWALLGLTSVQMAMGALVAGLDAGRTYTDWPLMGGQAVPDGMWSMSPIIRNVFENVATAQFNHRITAYILLAAGVYAAWRFRNEAQGGFKLFAAILGVQSVLGIVTLVHAAPLTLGLSHQAVGALALLLSVWLVWRTSDQSGASMSDAKST